jgi:hypothetical protein
MGLRKNIVLILSFILAQVSVAQTTDVVAITTVNDTGYFAKIRFGGYGEILYQQMNYGPDRYKDKEHGAPSDNRSYISLPRAVFAFDYKFRKDIILSAELEIEYGGTGSAIELEYAEGGEYEMEVEQAGEVALEQLHITKIFFGGKFNVCVGHMIVPVGLTNAHHEPLFFFGTARPEGETTILPSTWHETGIAINGRFSQLHYELMLVNGLDPNGFSTANWVASGRQKIFEKTVMTNPALAGRIEYSPVKGLRVAVSGYHGNSAKNASKPQQMANVKGAVTIVSSDVQYLTKNIAARANCIYGNLTDSKQISAINRTISRYTTFPRTDVAKNAITYGFEAGFNVFSFFKNAKSKLYPFVRYEYYNTMQDVQTGQTSDSRYKRDIFSFGLNYFILPGLVLKADYGIRRIDNGNLNNENTFGLTLAYTTWFYKK